MVASGSFATKDGVTYRISVSARNNRHAEPGEQSTSPNGEYFSERIKIPCGGIAIRIYFGFAWAEVRNGRASFIGVRMAAYARGLEVLRELLRPAALLASMMSLLAVMHTAFFGSETDYRQRIYDSLGMLLLAAGTALIGGLLFEGTGKETRNAGPVAAIFNTFPVRVFCWTTGLILALFLLTRWIEAFCIFSKEMRF
jgi:hypothetical protein